MHTYASKQTNEPGLLGAADRTDGAAAVCVLVAEGTRCAVAPPSPPCFAAETAAAAEMMDEPEDDEEEEECLMFLTAFSPEPEAEDGRDVFAAIVAAAGLP